MLDRRCPGLLIAAGVMVAALGCGGGEDAAPAGEAAEGAAPAVDPAVAATISGTVRFEGTAPAATAIDMSDEPTCAEKYADTPMTEQVVVNDDGTLRNVYVYVKDGLGDRTFPTATTSAPLDQNGCRYIPHVVALQVGQTLVIKNSDGLLHNINTQPTENRGFNVSQPFAMETGREFDFPEVMIPVKCDVHGWMEAYIGVQDHPFAAVTGEDGGFSLAGLPPGEYVIEAWHEAYGVQTTTVTVGAQETAAIEFTFSSDMAGADVPVGDPIDLHDHGDVASAR